MTREEINSAIAAFGERRLQVTEPEPAEIHAFPVRKTRTQKMQTAVTITRTFGSNLVIYSAWQEITAAMPGALPFRCISFVEPLGWVGRIGTETLPPSIDALPVGAERLAAVSAFHFERYRQAYAVIFAEYPALRDYPHELSCGNLELEAEAIPAVASL